MKNFKIYLGIFLIFVAIAAGEYLFTGNANYSFGITLFVVLAYLGNHYLSGCTVAQTKVGHTHDERHDNAVVRNRKGRWLFFIFSIFSFTVLPGIIAATLVGSTQLALLVFAIVAGLGGLAFAPLLPRYIVDVPQVQGFVTTDILRPLLNLPGSPYVIYGPGLHISYPWETRSEKSNFSLEVFTLKFTEAVPGKDTNLDVTGSYQFEVSLPRSDLFIGLEEETLQNGAVDIIKAEISASLADKGADDAKSTISEQNQKLMETFGLGKSETDKDDRVTAFEERYGIKTIQVTISGIDLPPEVQKTRNAIDEANQVYKGIASMYGMEVDELKEKVKSGAITTNDLHDMIDRFAAKSGNANMDIKAIKLSGIPDLSPLVAMFAGGKK